MELRAVCLMLMVVFYAGAARAEQSPILLELYTSQGCSSCPPADELFAHLGQSEDVVALAFHVDYWDYLGWKDIFSKAEWTRRQQAYVHHNQQAMVYTPQMVIAGHKFCVGSDAAEVAQALMDAAKLAERVQLRFDGAQHLIQLTSTTETLGQYEVVLAHVQSQQNVRIAHGENRGLAFTYTNIVQALEVLALWDGRATVIDVAQYLEQRQPGNRIAVFVQEIGQGPVVAARWLD